jgi:hypothetical protein
MAISVYSDFQTFVSNLSQAISKKLSAQYPREAVELICAEFRKESFGQILWETKRNWINHIDGEGAENRYDDVVSIFLIHLVGPMNRIALPAGVDGNRLLHAFLSLLASVLEHETVRGRFAVLSESVMRAA